MSDTYRDNIERAAQDELKAVDEDGAVFWVDSYDEDGVYYHADEGDSHRATHEQFRQWMEFVDA